MNALEDKIGYCFEKKAFLRQALIHSSVRQGDDQADYERLEFLGDRVVNLIVADILFHTFPEENEGLLAKRHSALVRTETLADIARDLDVGEHICLSDAESKAGGAANENILADVMEAVTAAIYLDGGFAAARDLIVRVMGDRLHAMSEPPRDPKTALQEWSQADNRGLPVYELVDQTGPDHAPEFTIRVSVEGVEPQEATSTSKKRAEKEAAQKMLDKI